MGSNPPSIKGASISSLIEDVAKMRDDGRASAALLDERLGEDERALLDQPVNLAGWYDVHSYRRLAELVCEVEGRREDLLRERGAAAARRLAASGLYQQMDYHTSRDESLESDAAFQLWGQSLRLITTLSGSLLNFGRFAVEPDPEHARRYCIVIHDAQEVPEVLAYTTEGFMNAMVEMGPVHRAGDPPMWRVERERDRVVYRMTRDFA